VRRKVALKLIKAGMASKELRGRFQSERQGHTLQATALVNEAYLRLAPGEPRLAEVVHLRFFAGLGIAETAEVLDLRPGVAAGADVVSSGAA
jgi:hypothetical protein